MQTYQSTPDFYREYIEHGWLKDQAAKTHKYIKRWRNKAGKWVYQYKSKVKETLDRYDRRMAHIPPEAISGTKSAEREPIKYLANGPFAKLHKKKYQSSFNIEDSKEHRGYSYSRSGSKGLTKNGISAGRQRAAKKKGYSGNLSSRGYSNSNSPKKKEYINLMGYEHIQDIYDEPSELWKNVGGPYKDQKYRNNKKVSRGVSAGRKRMANRKTKVTKTKVKPIKTTKLYVKPITIKKI